MADNSEKSELLLEKSELLLEESETIPKSEDKQEANEEVEKPAAKSRGRPAGSKDNKPRIKRVPVQQAPPQRQQQTAAEEVTHTPPKSQEKGLRFDTRKKSHSQKSQ